MAVVAAFCALAWAAAAGADPPAVTAQPTVSGSPLVGSTLAVDAGSWSSSSALSYSYQWQRCGDYNATVMADAPVGYWRLGESAGSTTIADSSGHGNAGTVTGGVTFGGAGAVADLNTAAAFDGSTGYVAVPPTAVPSGTGFTYELWVRSGAPNQTEAQVFGSSQGHAFPGLRIVIEGAGVQVKFMDTSSSAVNVVAGALTSNAWNHVVVTYDSAYVLRLYVNGVQASQGSGLAAIPAGDTAWIGRNTAFQTYYFSGGVDEVATYNTVLSPSRIEAHYAAGNCTDIGGATSNSYSLAGADAGATIRARITASNTDGSTTAASAPTATVTAPTEPINTVVPVVFGSYVEGEQLTATAGTWLGSQPQTYAYQWQDCVGGSCTNIAGATAPGYLLGPTDVGKTVEVVVTATNAVGSLSISSLPGTVFAATPVNQTPPTVSGNPTVGQQLSVSSGAWSGAAPISYAYQWQRCGVGYATAVLSDGPVDYWRLGDSTSVAADAGSGGDPGSYSGGYSLGQPGASPTDTNAAASFDGLSGTVTIPDAASLDPGSSSFTMEAWVDPTTVSDGQEYVFRKKRTGSPWTGYAVWLQDGKWQAEVANTAGTYVDLASDVSAVAGVWTHLVLVVNQSAGKVILYVNGQAQSSQPSFAGNTTINWPAYIGSSNAAGVFFGGAIDEVAVYPGAMSPARIMAHYAAGSCTDILPADSSQAQSYSPVAADVGFTLRARVVATNKSGAATAASSVTGLVTTGAGPVDTSLPVVSGSPTVGQQLSVSSGAWSGAAPISYAYQWQRCGGYAGQVLGDSPTAYWRLGESSGSVAADASGNGHVGTYSSVTLGGTSPFAYDADTAAVFNGSSSQVGVSGLSFGGSFSVEFWAKRSLSGTFEQVAGQGTGGANAALAFGFQTSGNVFFSFYDDDVNSAATYMDTGWHHYAFTYNASSRARVIYRDGVQVGSDIASGAYTGSGPFYIGRAGDGFNFAGSIDDFAIYPTVLSAAQVQADDDAAGCVNIGGATNQSYTAGAADVGAKLRAQVTATNSQGAATSTSAVTPAVSGANGPANTSLPAVIGSSTVGQTLSVSSGSWSGAGPINYAYQWQRCGAYTQTVAADAPRDWWRFGEAAGASASADAGPGGVSVGWSGGVSLGATGATPDGDGSARLDGATGGGTLSSSVQFDSGDFTIEGWFKSSSSGLQPIYTVGTDWVYPMMSVWMDGGRVSLYVLTPAGGNYEADSASSSYADGRWHYFAAERQGGTLSVYVDGALAGSASAPVVDYDAPGRLARIGWGLVSSPVLDFNGGLDDFAIYGRALTAAQVQAHYGAASCANIAGATGSSYTVTPADVGSTIRATVAATNGAGTVTAPSAAVGPVAPGLVSPSDDGGVPTLTPTLTASTVTVPGTVSYQFQVSADQSFQTGVTQSAWLASTPSWQVPASAGLQDETHYYWQARAQVNGVTTAWSVPRRFLVRASRLGLESYWPYWSDGHLAVNEASGNLVVSLPGPSFATPTGSMGVSLTYNSQDPRPDQGLGQGWTLDGGDVNGNPPTQLIDHSQLTGANQYQAAEVVWPDGGSSFYSHVGTSNTYLSPPGDTSTLKRNGDGSWTLAGEDGSIYAFSATGSNGAYTLVSATYVDATSTSGLAYTYAPNGSGPSLLTAVADTANPGRQLTLTWHALNASGCPSAIVCVTGPDGVVWRYIGSAGGGTSGPLVKVNDGVRDLFAVAYGSNGKVSSFQNADDLSAAGAPGLNPAYHANHAVTFAYNGATLAQVTSVNEGQVIGRTASPTWTFAYTDCTGAPCLTSATHDDHGQLPAGTQRTAAGYTTVTPPNQQGVPSPLTRKVYVDDLDHPIEIDDVLGHRWLTGYNSHDEVTWTEDPLGNATDTVWNTVDDVPVSTTGPDLGSPLGRLTTTYAYDEQQVGSSAGGTFAPGTPVQGLEAWYYANTNLAGRPAARVTAPQVDFNWGSTTPSQLGSYSGTGFSAHFQGDLVVPSSGHYTFTTVTNGASEGTWLTVDGTAAISNWSSPAATAASQPVLLSPGRHKITLDYTDRQAPAQLHLRWSCSDCNPNLTDNVIDPGSLLPVWGNRTSTVSPSGRISFSHFADPASGHPDYTLQMLDASTPVITSYGYDAYGRPLKVVSPLGNQSMSLDPAGNLQGSVTAGYATTYSYYAPAPNTPIVEPGFCGTSSADQAQALQRVVPAGTSPTVYVYDSAGRQLAKTDGAGTTCTAYDSEGRVTSSTDGDGHVTSYGYDPAGNQVSSTAPDGTVTKASYDELGAVPSTTDGNGHVSQRSYDLEGNELSSKDPLSRPTTWTYDAAGDKLTSTDPAGNITTYGYDAAGRRTSTTIAGPGQIADPRTTTVYNAAGWVMQKTDPDGNTTRFSYDADGERTSVTDPLTNSTTSVYDSLGRLKATTDANGHTTSYAYDLNGDKTSVTAADTGVTTMVYDKAGNVVSSTDALGNPPTLYAYDGANRLVKTTAPTGEKTTTAWDAAGNKLSTTDAAGNTTKYVYDALNRLVATTTPMGETTRAGYDDAGNVVTRTDARGNTTHFTYDAANEQIHVKDPFGHVTSTTYDGDGHVLSQTDADGNTTSFQYTAEGWVKDVSALDTAETTNTYDPDGNLLTRTVGANPPTTYTYDADGRLASKVDQLGATWTYGYDKVGNRTTVVDANGNTVGAPTGSGTTTYTYDPVNRLKSVAYSDSTPSVTYGYDLAGNRTSMTDGGGTVTYTYDASNRITAQSRAGGQSISYAYNALGQLTSRTYPGQVTAYAYDLDGRPSTVQVGSAPPTTYSYDADGRVTATAFPNGWTEQRTYDVAGRLMDIRSVNGSQTIAAASYALDAAGNPTTIQRDGVAEHYSYDHANRVTAVCYGGAIATCATGSLITYQYDGAGNRTGQVSFGVSTTYVYNGADELTSSVSNSVTTPYSYDADGNETGSGSRAIAFDVAGQVTAIRDGSSTTASFTYDGDGNRLTKTAGSATTSYLWDSAASLPMLAEEKNGTSVQRTYEYGGDSGSGLDLLAMGAGGGAFYFHSDLGGSTAAVTSGAGAVEWTYTYDPYGNSRTTTKVDASAPANVAQFAGQLLDPETGLIDLRARLYDPSTGRLLSRDPLSQATSDPGMSVYGYGADSPLTHKDPSGNRPVLDDSTAVIVWTLPNQPAGTVMVTDGDRGGTKVVATADAPPSPPSPPPSPPSPPSPPPPPPPPPAEPSPASTSPASGSDSSVDAGGIYNGPDQSARPYTLGICAGGNVMLLIYELTADECLTRTRNSSDEIGFTTTAGSGVGFGDFAGVSLFYSYSNASSLSELAGPFYFYSAGVALFVGPTATVFWNGSLTDPIYGINIGVSIGAGARVAGGVTDTAVARIGGHWWDSWEASIADRVWSFFNDSKYSPPTYLNRAYLFLSNLTNGWLKTP